MNQFFHHLSRSLSSPFLATGLICCFLMGCSSSSQEPIKQFEKPFFDLQAYFQSEIERLNEDNPEMKKEVTFNGSIETQRMEQKDFSQELKLFRNADINRRALIDKYQSDSLIDNSQIDRLSYTALDSSLNVRKIVIDYEQGEVAQVDIYKKQKSFVGSSQQHLRYKPKQGYSINSFQKTILSEPKRLKIETSFLQ